MYLLYLDESENANQNRKSIITPNVFGLSGLLVTSRYTTSVVDEINDIKEKYKIPADWDYIHTKYSQVHQNGRKKSVMIKEERCVEI